MTPDEARPKHPRRRQRRAKAAQTEAAAAIMAEAGIRNPLAIKTVSGMGAGE